MLLFKCTRRAGWLVGATLALTAPVAHAGDTKPDKAEKPAKVVGKAETKPGALAPAKNAACAERTFTKVFSPWHDRALYTLAEGGDFEAQAAGWTLAGADVDRGRQLAVPARRHARHVVARAAGRGLGGQPADLRHPWVPQLPAPGEVGERRSGRRPRPGALRHGQAEVRRPDPAGRRVGAHPQDLARPGALSRPVRHGASTFVRLRFAATEGSVRLDDVYVDPRYNR